MAPASSNPAYYLDNTSGLMPQLQGTGSVLVPANVYRTQNGVAVQQLGSNGSWAQLGPPPTSGFACQRTDLCSPLTDTASPSCAAPPNCFGSDPAYYETMRVANHLLGPSDPAGYVLGRQADGLHVFSLEPFTSPLGGTYLGWGSFFPVLTALADPSGGVAPASEWSSIRTGDITGDGHTDIIALVNGELQAWELTSNSSGELSWSAVPINPQVSLSGSWSSDASRYSTIQVGPVAGPGSPDAVVARGPFGIRTWFYNLHHSGGWTSWLPQNHCPPTPNSAAGQAAAWSEVSSLSGYATRGGPTGTIRDAWIATTPTANDLTQLNTKVLNFANCTGKPSLNPPAYPACAVPGGSSGFTEGEWTAVVNETLAEIYYAQETVDFFNELSKLNGETFLAESNELPALADSVAALSQAAGNNSSQISPQAIWTTGLGIAGSTAGLLQPELGVLLGIASYLAGIIPSAIPEVNGPSFTGTITDLENKLATAVSGASKAVDVQTSEVLQNYGMLQLLAQLHGPSGPWNTVNSVGLSGSMQEGFVLWAYKQLLPTVLERDVVSDCNSGGGKDPNTGDQVVCDASTTPASTGGPPGPFAILDSPHTVGAAVTSSYPCWGFFTFVCHYESPPTTGIATQVWGTPADTCVFDGTPETEWTYGCNLGVKPLVERRRRRRAGQRVELHDLHRHPAAVRPGDLQRQSWVVFELDVGSGDPGIKRKRDADGVGGAATRLQAPQRDARRRPPALRAARAWPTHHDQLGPLARDREAQGDRRQARHAGRHGARECPGSPADHADPAPAAQPPGGVDPERQPSRRRDSLRLPEAARVDRADHDTVHASDLAQAQRRPSHSGRVTARAVDVRAQPSGIGNRPAHRENAVAGAASRAGDLGHRAPPGHRGCDGRRTRSGVHNTRRSSRVRNASSLWHILAHAVLVPVTTRTHVVVRLPSRGAPPTRSATSRQDQALAGCGSAFPQGLRRASISRVCFARRCDRGFRALRRRAGVLRGPRQIDRVRSAPPDRRAVSGEGADRVLGACARRDAEAAACAGGDPHAEVHSPLIAGSERGQAPVADTVSGVRRDDLHVLERQRRACPCAACGSR